MDLRHRNSWSLEVANEDLLLILKALGGRLDSEDWQAKARDLGDRISLIKAKTLIALGKEAEVLVLRIEDAQAGRDKTRLPPPGMRSGSMKNLTLRGEQE